MTEIIRTALVPYSAEQMYNLVNDVLTYPEFLPWCKSSHIVAEGNDWLEIELVAHKGSIKQSFTTRNTGIPYQSVQMELVDKGKSPFKKLHGLWLFKALDNSSCKIEFKLDLELGHSPLSLILKPLFSKIATTMVDAFYQRAKEVYGVAHD